ncbi:MAG: SpoIIE family protein phosphatase [Pelosinus sp.]|nr:SpoIIE family protein phosphatase [Pelosinus sp.]
MDNSRPIASSGKRLGLYDNGTIRVVFFACCIIVLAVVLTSSISYSITKNAMVDKLKNRDMPYLVQSMKEKIDGRIERARETSLLLAKDQAVLAWVSSGGQDYAAGKMAQAKLSDIGKNYDYAKSFLASAAANQYWTEDANTVLDLSRNNPLDAWFYNALQSGQKVSLNIDYDRIYKSTFVYVNVLAGDVCQPVGVAGVALSLKDIAKEFSTDKFGENSNLWLVDNQGQIHLADNLEYIGRSVSEFLPADVIQQILGDMDNAKPKVLEYKDSQGQTMDLAYQSTVTTDWKLVFQIPRQESISILDSIKINAMIASVITILLMVFIFYFISYKIANPFKRALALAEEMENQVKLRTHELAEKNQNIMDSIDYAKRLQEAVLPSPNEWTAICRDYFVLWRPRDTVGGDFYWIRSLNATDSLIVLGDCTGHGVPGALMTMLVHSILNNMADNFESAGQMLEELNRRVQATLHRKAENKVSDDGLDVAICYIKDRRLEFAGAKIPLYIKRDGQVHVLKGDNRSIGYRRSKIDMDVSCHFWDIEAGDSLYLTTDGYIDQNGGTKDYPMGRKAFVECIAKMAPDTSLRQQQASFEHTLKAYMGAEPQRDDITVIGLAFQ